MIDRRTVIQSAPIAALAIGGAVGAETTDPHPALVSEQKAIFKRLFRPDAPDIESDNPVWVRCKEIEHCICTTPETTPEGAAAQLEFAMSVEANFDLTGAVAGDLDGQILRNVLATLKSLTREAHMTIHRKAMLKSSLPLLAGTIATGAVASNILEPEAETSIQILYCEWEDLGNCYGDAIDENNALAARLKADNHPDRCGLEEGHYKEHVDPLYLEFMALENKMMVLPSQDFKDLAINARISARMDGVIDNEFNRLIREDADRLMGYVNIQMANHDRLRKPPLEPCGFFVLRSAS